MSSIHSPTDPTDPPTSISAQLGAWHANRGSKSFARAMIPSWKTQESEDEVIYNPVKLLGMLKPMDWAYFFTGWFAWTCDGYVLSHPVWWGLVGGGGVGRGEGGWRK